MHNTASVSHSQRFGYGDPNLVNLGQRNSAFAKSLGQSFPFQKLHDQIISAILRADVIKLADVGMVQRRDRPALALHSLLEFRRRRKVGSKNLHRHGAVEASVTSTINFSHAARAQRRLDFVGAELRARGKSHRLAPL